MHVPASFRAFLPAPGTSPRVWRAGRAKFAGQNQARREAIARRFAGLPGVVTPRFAAFLADMSGVRPAAMAGPHHVREALGLDYIGVDFGLARADAKILSKVLCDRIERENTEFYPLVDAAV